MTFSRDLESQSSSSQDKITHSHEVHNDLGEKPCPTENREMIHAKKSAEFLLGFQVGLAVESYSYSRHTYH